MLLDRRDQISIFKSDLFTKVLRYRNFSFNFSNFIIFGEFILLM